MTTAGHPHMTTGTTPEPTYGPLTFDELGLAFRNKGMPLEAIRYDVTPVGLHYQVLHFDIPEVDPTTWRLAIGGHVERPLELTLDDIRRRPSVTLPGDHGMRGERPRSDSSRGPLSLPWLHEAIGTAEWTGTPLWPLIEEAGPTADAIQLVFRGADRGFQNEDEHDYGRSLSLAEAQRPEVMLAYEMNGQPLQPQHGFPLRLLVPGWYGMTSVKWLTSIEAVSEPFDGYQQAVAYHYKRDADDPGEPVTRLRVRALMIPPGIPDFFTRQRVAEAGRIDAQRSRLVRRRADRARRGRYGWRLARGNARRRGRPFAVASVVVPVGRDRRRTRAVVPGDGRRRGTPSRSTRRGTSRVTATTRSSASASPSAEGTFEHEDAPIHRTDSALSRWS